MPEEKYQDSGESPDLNPEVGDLMDHLDTVEVTRLATIFFTADKLAQKKYGTSMESLMQKKESNIDSPEINEVIKEASKIVGSSDEYLHDHTMWEVSKQKSGETLNFEEWRKINREDYHQRLQKLDAKND